MEIVRAFIKAPNERRQNAAYNKIFGLFNSKYTSLEEYEVEGVYIVDLPMSAINMIDGINEIPFVTAESIVFPKEVVDIINSFEDETYTECTRIENELKPLGYTFDWYLDAIPYYLRKIK